MEPQVISYAGFWKRFVAYIIDSTIIGAVTFIVLIPFIVLLGIGVGVGESMENQEAVAGLIGLLIGAYLLAILVLIIAQWLYFSLMESSSRQATLGKIAMGIMVTDLGGGQISFGKATARYFGKIVSGLIFGIGYLLAAFTEKKQALHDIMAGTLIVNK